jgi:hypothetical protein
MAQLLMTREPRYADKIRAYKIWIDGVQHGSIKENQNVEIEIAPGPHKIWLTIDWVRSNKLDIIVSADCSFCCHSNVQPILAIIAMFQPSKWIKLWQVT